MNPLSVIEKYYEKGSPLYTVLVDHSRDVARKSLEIAATLTHLNPDMDFIEKAAMLHDIGIIKTRAPAIGCEGPSPYICHGFLGRGILDNEGLPERYGLVAERHTGAGITLENIKKADLPLPLRDMVPVTLEEKIICCADKYFSKSPENRDKPMTRDRIIKELNRINPGHAVRFRGWAEAFNLE
ncbi:MAG: HDIG domain-containing protein [Desulfobacterales bacterium]|nr:HDIG domain-containing protein [Desulfobacterales bacterium]